MPGPRSASLPASYYADDNNPDNDSASVSTAVDQITALQIGKSHTPVGALINKQQVVFTLKPSFAGLAPTSQLVVTDTLPANFSFTLADVSAGAVWTCTKPDVQTVRCTRSALAGLQRSTVGTIRITATANWIENDPNDNSPVNTAYLNSGTLTEASGSDQVQILRAEADIQALKSVRGGPVNGGSVIVGTPFDFDITARNNGTSLNENSPFFGKLVLDDTLTTNITATNIVTNGWTCNLGSATGPAIVTGPVSLSTGSVIHCERIYTSADPLRRGDVVPPVTVTAVVPTAGPFNNTLEAWPKDRDQYTDPNVDNNTTSFFGTGTTTTISADVTIFKSLTTAQPLWGDRSEFVLEPQNLGNPDQDSQGVIITDLFTNLANNTVLMSIVCQPTSRSGLTCDAQVAVSSSSRQLTCRITTLKPCTRGVDCPKIKVSAALAGNSTNPQVTTDAENTAFIASATSDPVPANNFSKINYTILSNPDASVTKTATPQTVNAGAELKYSISARIAAPNKGPTQAKIDDTLPYGMTFLRTSLPGELSPRLHVAAPAPDADKLTTKVTCTRALSSASGPQKVDIFVSPSGDLAAQSPIPNTVTLTATPELDAGQQHRRRQRHGGQHRASADGTEGGQSAHQLPNAGHRLRHQGQQPRRRHGDERRGPRLPSTGHAVRVLHAAVGCHLPGCAECRSKYQRGDRPLHDPDADHGRRCVQVLRDDAEKHQGLDTHKHGRGPARPHLG